MKHPKTLSAPSLARILALLATVVSLLLLASCNMHVSDDRNGDKKKVNIETPFGDLKVRTNDVEAKDTGLPVYPGAKPKPKDGKDEHSADVNMSFGNFGLKVVALSYTSEDSPDKILDFYRKEMKSYGTILECKGGGMNITHKSGSHELSCDKGDIDHGAMQLKVGTEERQRVVEVKPIGKGSEFTLVYVQTRGGDEGKL